MNDHPKNSLLKKMCSLLFATASVLAIILPTVLSAAPSEPGDWSKVRLYGHAFKNEDFTDDQYEFIINNMGIFTVEKRHARDIYGATNTEDAAEATAERIHEGNPNCKVLIYWSTNTAYTNYYTTVAAAISENPDWIDSSNSRYIYPDDCKDWWVEEANDIVTTRGLDGIFGDGAPGAESRGYISDVNDNLAALSDLSCFNIYNGYRVATASKIYAGSNTLANADGVMCEAFFRVPCDTKDEAVFQMDEFLEIPSDKYIICRGASGVFGTTHDFTLACCLILANDYTYYSWGGDDNSYAGDDTMTYWDSDFEQEIGEPLDIATKDGYTYSRVFEHCTVNVDFENATSSIVWDQDNGTTNEAPTATSASYSIDINEETSIILTGMDPEGSNLTYSVVSFPEHGSLSGTAPDLTYTPTTDYTGADSFTFDVSDGVYTSAVATISIQINEIGSITWTAANDISETSDVSTNGTPVWAYSFGAASTSVVNGITFIGESNAVGNADVITDLTGSYTGFGNSAGTFSTLATDYQSILESGAYGSGNSTTITLSGLSTGSEYEVQFWVNDSRNRTDMDSKPRTATLSDDSIVLDYNTSGASTDDGLGQYIVGTFNATETTQEIELDTVVPQLNAIQLRITSELSSSEQSTLVESFCGVTSGGTNMILSWTAASDSTYSVEATTNLVNGPWIDLTNNIVGQGELISVTNHLTEGQQFFRIYLK